MSSAGRWYGGRKATPFGGGDDSPELLAGSMSPDLPDALARGSPPMARPPTMATISSPAPTVEARLSRLGSPNMSSSVSQPIPVASSSRRRPPAQSSQQSRPPFPSRLSMDSAGGSSGFSSPIGDPVRATQRFQVTGSGGIGSAAPLLSLSRSPDPVHERVAVASQTALKVLSVYRGDAEPVIAESMDVRHRVERGRAYRLTDVRWGFNQTANKLVTGCSNGYVVLWDLHSATREGRFERATCEHDRAINRVAIAGPSGNWMMSASQDGFCKIWDLRVSSVAHTALYSAADSVRDVAFAPSTGQPDCYILVTVHESGVLSRWDMRKVAQPTDRIQAHVGGGGAMCVRWNPEGWIATGGMDRTVKVWNASTLSSTVRPVHTLHTARPVAKLCWRPDAPTELAITPHLSVMASVADGDAQGPASSATVTDEVEIWDVRRESVPKYVLRSGEGAVSGAWARLLSADATALVFADSNRLWTTHRSSGIFMQQDIHFDTTRPLDDLPRLGVGWSSAGDLAFAASVRHADDLPFDDGAYKRVSSVYDPDQPLAHVPSADLTFDAATFAALAAAYEISGPLEAICERNAAVRSLLRLMS